MIYLSVVSHGHIDIIKSLNSLPKLAKDKEVKVCVKDNLKDPALEQYCQDNDIDYVTSYEIMGFGENNNFVYDFYSGVIKDDDFFVVFNPDVDVSAEKLKIATNIMLEQQAEIATINLYRDVEFLVPDNSIRYFPNVRDFFTSYFMGKNTTIINKGNIHEPQFVDWAAGSFLLFKSGFFHKLKGFNCKYFMYCEDVDICWRAYSLFSQKVLFIPSIKGLHYAQFNNRRFLSKHFFWHVKSALIFLMYRYGLRKKTRSNIK